MDHLAHQGRPILQEVVENLSLDSKPAGACPLGILWLERAIKLRWLERVRDRVEVGRVGVDGGRGAGSSSEGHHRERGE